MSLQSLICLRNIPRPCLPRSRRSRAASRDRYASLRPAERRIADLILNFPGEIAGYSATELAVMAETSNAAVSRFVQRIGFQSYDEMRILSRELENGGVAALSDGPVGRS